MVSSDYQEFTNRVNTQQRDLTVICDDFASAEA
jgi:hypothetical protein